MRTVFHALVAYTGLGAKEPAVLEPGPRQWACPTRHDQCRYKGRKVCGRSLGERTVFEALKEDDAFLEIRRRKRICRLRLSGAVAGMQAARMPRGMERQRNDHAKTRMFWRSD